ncbi:MAG: fibronectin type III domain-containing protein, partial [Burkholderiales bacterium]|nr:fibronectin type III domain-containing protein [Burkholderiales bacterium]
GVSALSGNGVASVAFSPPAAGGGSPLTGYTVTANPGGASASGNASPLVVSGLSNGTAYTFTVRAANASGLGAPSLASNAVTPAVAPGAVAILNWGIFNRDARQVHVFFNAADPGGPSLPDNPIGILDYTARAYNAATEVVDTVMSASPPVTNITATGRAQYLQLTLPFDPCEVHAGTTTLRLTVVARSATGMGPLLYFNAGRALFGASQCP